MITTLLFFLSLAALANWQVVETIHHGSIFAEFRARMEARNDFLGDLFMCPFCLGHWTGLTMTALATCSALAVEQGTPVWLAGFMLYWFAVVRVSQLLNDYLHPYCRTPRLDSDTTLVDLEEELNRIGKDTTENP